MREKGKSNQPIRLVACVLLSRNRWDRQQFRDDFRDEWGIDLAPEEAGDDETLTATVNGTVLAASLMPFPVPNGEAAQFAENNSAWEEAVGTAQSHQAHILVVACGTADAIETGKLFVKAVASWLRQPDATAVYTNMYVFQPSAYREVASWMRHADGPLPVLDWVWFGVCRTESLQGVYTCGMRQFGKEEMEVYADAPPDELCDLLLDVAAFVLSDNVTLRDGETIGYSKQQRLPVSLSKGIAMDGMTLKIEYRT